MAMAASVKTNTNATNQLNSGRCRSPLISPIHGAKVVAYRTSTAVIGTSAKKCAAAKSAPKIATDNSNAGRCVASAGRDQANAAKTVRQTAQALATQRPAFELSVAILGALL